MRTSRPTISVIIRTLCETLRRDTILRAIRSIQSQEGLAVEIIVIVNGDRYDHALLADLQGRTDLRLHYLAEQGLPAAMRIGRLHVSSEFFSFLDDDDEYLPGALRARVTPMLESDAIDVVVGNGFCGPGGSYPSGRRSRGDPLRELLINNWLSSCGAVYRSSRIDVDYLNDLPAYFEWTYLAYKLCLSRRLAFVDRPGHLIHDTASSASKSMDYVLTEVTVLERILELDLPVDVRRALRAKCGAALHVMANLHLEKAEFENAWKAHIKSLLQPKGIRYLLYTRKLLARKAISSKSGSI